MLNQAFLRFGVVFLVGASAIGAAVCHGQTVDWPVYNGGADGDHYSKLTQIDRGNVSKLQVAWSFDTGEKGGIQSNPLDRGADSLHVYADAESRCAGRGDRQAEVEVRLRRSMARSRRGDLAYWTDGKEGRIFAGVMNFLYCLDAETGKPIETFGESGRVDLRKGLDRDGDYREAVDCADFAGRGLQGPDHRGGPQPGDASGAAGLHSRV